MVLICLGYGLGCGLDMVLIWFGNGAPFSVIQGSQYVGFKKGNRNSPGTGFWSISRGFLWFWYDFDMVLIRCWYSFDNFDLILLWFWWVGFKKGNRNSPGTGFWSISRGCLWFWYDFDMVLIRFWNAEGDLVFSQVFLPKPLRNPHFLT